jgi:hypothetical protein
MLRRQAYSEAMERAVAELLRQRPMQADELRRLVLRDLPPGECRTALMRHRFTLGLSLCPNSRVLVDDVGTPVPLAAVLASVFVS